MIKGDSGARPGHWAIKGGNAQAGGLKVYWDDVQMQQDKMKKQGALILGILAPWALAHSTKGA